MKTPRERAQLAEDTAKKIRDYTLATLMTGLTRQSIETYELLAAAADAIREVAPKVDDYGAYTDLYGRTRYIHGSTPAEIVDALKDLPGGTVIQDSTNITWQAHFYTHPGVERWYNTRCDPPVDDWALRHLAPFRILYTPDHDPNVENGYRRVT